MINIIFSRQWHECSHPAIHSHLISILMDEFFSVGQILFPLILFVVSSNIQNRIMYVIYVCSLGGCSRSSQLLNSPRYRMEWSHQRSIVPMNAILWSVTYPTAIENRDLCSVVQTTWLLTWSQILPISLCAMPCGALSSCAHDLIDLCQVNSAIMCTWTKKEMPICRSGTLHIPLMTTYMTETWVHVHMDANCTRVFLHTGLFSWHFWSGHVSGHVTHFSAFMLSYDWYMITFTDHLTNYMATSPKMHWSHTITKYTWLHCWKFIWSAYIVTWPHTWLDMLHVRTTWQTHEGTPGLSA